MTQLPIRNVRRSCSWAHLQEQFGVKNLELIPLPKGTSTWSPPVEGRPCSATEPQLHHRESGYQPSEGRWRNQKKNKGYLFW